MSVIHHVVLWIQYLLLSYAFWSVRINGTFPCDQPAQADPYMAQVVLHYIVKSDI